MRREEGYSLIFDVGNGAGVVVAADTTLDLTPRVLDVEVADPDKDQWLSGVKPKITDIGGIALAPSSEAGKSSGFIIYFSPYAVGSYAEGEYVVFIPYGAFQSTLSATGAALFGGTFLAVSAAATALIRQSRPQPQWSRTLAGFTADL